MTDIVVAEKLVSVAGDIKRVIIQTSSAADTGHTYDTNMDAANGRGAEFKKIYNAYHVGLTGTQVAASWNNSTGIITLGTVAGGPAVVNLVIEGK